MSPIEQIADGIHTGNWQAVCEGYEQLTGEWISPPSAENDEIKDAMREIMDIACIALKPKETKKEKVNYSKKSKKKKVRRETVSDDDPTLLLDDDKITVTHAQTGGTRLITNEPYLDEIENNKRNAIKTKKNKIKLNRTPKQTYMVECNECGKKFESDRPDGEMGQKCRECLNDKKGRFS